MRLPWTRRAGEAKQSSDAAACCAPLENELILPSNLVISLPFHRPNPNHRPAEDPMRRAIIVSMSYLVICSIASAAGKSQMAPRRAVQPGRAHLTLAAAAAAKQITRNAQGDGEGRRCAFFGRFGSFTVIGSRGTAAYRLGNGRYIADLQSAGEDANWWLYRPVRNGDPSTIMWAFARFPRCGRYRVLRFAKGAWWVYEHTEAWGNRLGQAGGVQATSLDEPTNAELLNKLQVIEGKLNDIQPTARPSLKDIEDLIKQGT